jgi:pyridoxal phosphate enzyme (YggS family)
MTAAEEVETLRARLAAVRARIAAALAAAGRAPDAVTLVAVSKTVELARCAAALAAGQTVLGENYAQELRDKARALPAARFHFLGPLQRNKVKYVVGTAELVHSVDAPPLAEEIGRRARALGVEQRALLQVNVGKEPQKSGCAPGELPALLDACRRVAGLRVEGLMCIPPEKGDPRPHFATLRTLAAAHGLPSLSMGMSGDFEAAIAEGATIVRVGTAIFGARA